MHVCSDRITSHISDFVRLSILVQPSTPTSPRPANCGIAMKSFHSKPSLNPVVPCEAIQLLDFPIQDNLSPTKPLASDHDEDTANIFFGIPFHKPDTCKNCRCSQSALNHFPHFITTLITGPIHHPFGPIKERLAPISTPLKGMWFQTEGFPNRTRVK